MSKLHVRNEARTNLYKMVQRLENMYETLYLLKEKGYEDYSEIMDQVEVVCGLLTLTITATKQLRDLI